VEILTVAILIVAMEPAATWEPAVAAMSAGECFDSE